ncbi:MAG: Acetolactate synthase large subunit protein [Myxococcales bacterium]|nr:Acetolactate synthase large subunit protein [Myxococcales bacterium]
MSFHISTEPTSASALHPLRVLVVDDDALQLRAVQRRLASSKSVMLTVVDNAIDALLAIGTMKPDLVVMDVFMPGLDGIEACRRIKANPETRDVKVILASAAMGEDLIAQARAVGASNAVSKPVDLMALIENKAAVERPARLASGTLAPPLSALVNGIPAAAEPAPMVRGADLLVSMLEEAGVDVVFGLPGGAISPVHDALLDSKIRVVTTRHEAGAMFAAAAHARASGKLAVVAVTSGPGVLNSMTGLATAWCDGVPVLLLVGEVPRAAHGKGVLQDGSSHGLQIVEMARHVSKLALEVPRASALPHLLRRGIATALSGRQGPVVMTLPIDVTTAQVAAPRVSGSITMAGMVEPESLDEVAHLIRHAKRPLILAGSGIRSHNAPLRLRAVAELLSCPVATTPKGKGVFPEDHPLALGVLGLGGHPSTRAYLESGVDVIVAIGTSLGDMSTDGFSPLLQSATLIHVDIDARQVGKSYAPTHAIVASAHEFLGGLADRISAQPRTVRANPTAGVVRATIASSTRTDRIASHDAIDGIQRMLPDDTIYTVDSGEHFLFSAHYLRTNHPDSFLVMTGLGSMGQSIPAAIGAQLAHPERSVAAIVGDGCFAMNAFEVATAVAERLPIRVFVFNDQKLGMVEDGHKAVYGRKPSYPTNPLDVCLVARGLGAATMRVETIEQLAACADLLAHHPGPVVIDVAIDGEIHLPKIDRVAAMKERPTAEAPSASNAFGVSVIPPRVLN